MSLDISLLSSGGLGVCSFGQNRGGFSERLGGVCYLLNHLTKVPDAGVHRIGKDTQLVLALKIDTSRKITFRKFLDLARAGDDRPGDRATDKESGYPER